MTRWIAHTFAALCLSMLALGCCKPKPVPVPPPEPPPMSEPVYRTDSLEKDATTEALVAALTMDFIETRAALRKALTILDGYRKPKPAQPEEKK